MGKIILNDWKKIPNLVSLVRILFIPLVFILFNKPELNRWFIILSLIIFSLLDNLDGFLARKLNQITELGKLIDPLVDKLFIISFAVNLMYYDLIPSWFFYLVIGRDLIIMLAGLLLMGKIKEVPASDFIGKMTVGAIGVVFLMSVMNFQNLETIFNLSLQICTVLIFISLFNYGYKQIRKIK